MPSNTSTSETGPSNPPTELVVDERVGQMLEEAYINRQFFIPCHTSKDNPYYPDTDVTVSYYLLEISRPPGLTIWKIEIKDELKAQLTRQPKYQSTEVSNTLQIFDKTVAEPHYRNAQPDEVAAVQSILDSLIPTDS